MDSQKAVESEWVYDILYVSILLKLQTALAFQRCITTYYLHPPHPPTNYWLVGQQRFRQGSVS